MTQASDTPRCGKLVERLRHEASLRDHYGDPILEDATDCIEKLERALATARADALEAAAIIAWSAGMDAHEKAQGLPIDAREVGSLAARRIRAAKEKAPHDSQ